MDRLDSLVVDHLQDRLFQPDRLTALLGSVMARRSERRLTAECTIHGLWNAIGLILDLYSPQACANYFANCGYDEA